MAQKSSRRSSSGKKTSSGKPRHRSARKRKYAHRPYNWPFILAAAVIVSSFGIITLLNGDSREGWKESWNELLSNFSDMFEVFRPEEAAEIPPPADGTVQVHFIDVGQGDSMLIQGGGEAVLIDAGENDQGDMVVSYLEAAGVRHLNTVIGTHPHSDHIGGIDDVLYSIPADEIWMPEIPDELIPTTRTYTDLLDAVEKTGVSAVIPEPGEKIDVCGGQLEVLGPVRTYDNLNDISIVARFTYGETSFLFTGDMEEPAETDLVAAGTDLRADVLKVGHHGSRTSSTPDFLRAVSPDICVIEAGEGNRHGHPHRETLALLEELCGEIWRTDLNGTVVMTSDGSRIDVSARK